MKRATTLCGAVLAALSIMLVASASAAHPGRNGLIAYVFDNAIYSVYPDGSHKKKIVPKQDVYRLGAAAYPTWSPDGKKIAFIAVRTPLSGEGEPETDLFVMNADGSDAEALSAVARATDFATGTGTMSWSPDGSEIAYTRNSGPYGNPYRQVDVIRADGRPGRNLRLPGEAWDPAWSPDGRTIVFGRSDGLYLVDADGYDPHRLLPVAFAEHPDWSPDGTKLLVDYHGGGRAVVYTANADGSNLRVAYEDDSGGYAARWSPDGTRIVLTVIGGDFTESIEYLRPDGTAQRPTFGTVLGVMPDWQPCGQGAKCPDTTPCVVPRVTGLSLTRARTSLRRAHCAVGTIKHPPRVPLGKTVVSKQSPRAKSRLPNGGKVNLVFRPRR